MINIFYIHRDYLSFSVFFYDDFKSRYTCLCVCIYIYVICTYLSKDNSKIINNEVACYNYDKIRKVGKENEKINQERVV